LEYVLKIFDLSFKFGSLPFYICHVQVDLLPVYISHGIIAFDDKYNI